MTLWCVFYELGPDSAKLLSEFSRNENAELGSIIIKMKIIIKTSEKPVVGPLDE